MQRDDMNSYYFLHFWFGEECMLGRGEVMDSWEYGRSPCPQSVFGVGWRSVFVSVLDGGRGGDMGSSD
jgi:hypothetical protein